jgi:hypothetical protein
LGKSIYETVRSALTEKAEVYQINAILNQLGITDYEQKIDISVWRTEEACSFSNFFDPES